ncbi:MAG: SPOR domain-containing protein [Cyclobacteriaceae bacterium]
MKHLILSSLFVISLCFTAHSQEAKRFYVTIGVFVKESNAKNLKEKATLQGYDVRYGQKSNGNLHYVYVLSTTDKQAAEKLVAKLRAETEYKLAWIFIGFLVGDVIEETPGV